MLKQIKNLGETLGRNQLLSIKGGKMNCFRNGACSECTARCGEPRCSSGIDPTCP